MSSASSTPPPSAFFCAKSAAATSSSIGRCWSISPGSERPLNDLQSKPESPNRGRQTGAILIPRRQSRELLYEFSSVRVENGKGIDRRRLDGRWFWLFLSQRQDGRRDLVGVLRDQRDGLT